MYHVSGDVWDTTRCLVQSYLHFPTFSMSHIRDWCFCNFILSISNNIVKVYRISVRLKYEPTVVLSLRHHTSLFILNECILIFRVSLTTSPTERDPVSGLMSVSLIVYTLPNIFLSAGRWYSKFSPRWIVL